MDFQKINLFIDVVKLGSYTAVSQSRDLDPSMISKSITSLEKELGTKLFFRTTRKLSPTDAGMQFYSKVEPIMEELEKAKNFLIEKRDTPSGIIRVTSPVSFGLLFLIPFVTKFQIKFPEVQVELMITDSVVNLVDERIDVAIRFGHLEDSTFVGNKLAPLDYVPCASPGYLKKYGHPKAPQDLVKHNCLSFLFPGFADGWLFRNRKTGSEARVPINGSLRISNAIGLRDAAVLGAGISLLPGLLVGREIKRGSLIPLFTNHEVTATEFDANAWLLYSSKDFLPTKVKVFVEFLKNELGKIKYYEAYR